MRSNCTKAFILALLFAGLGAQRAHAGFAVRFFYNNIPGTAVADLVNAKATNSSGVVYNIYPNGPNADGSPLQSETLTQYLEGSQNVAENFGSMIQGYLEAPQAGAYTFWLASDDSSELWLSTTANPAGATLIASLSGATGSQNWTANASQKSAAITLAKGQICYYKVIHKEGGGGDNIAIGWTLPDGANQRPIPTRYAQPYPMSFYPIPSFLQDVADITTVENQTVVFSSTINGEPVNYQWYRDYTPQPMVALSGETLSSYSLKTTLKDNNAKFRLVVGTKQGMIISRPAVLKVNPDVTLPAVTAVSANVYNPFRIQVTFSEPVIPSTATDPANYLVDNGVMVFGAAMVDANNTGVYLYTSTLNFGINYGLTVSGVKDVATVPNTIATAVKNFKFLAPVVFKAYDNIGGTTMADITNNAAFKAGNASRKFFVTSLEKTDFADNYIGQIQAYVVPPVSGDYFFYVAGDDSTMLFLSSDDNPANKRMIAGYEGWTGSREYKKDAAQKSASLNLLAGQRYYIEGLVKEGGGGDHISIAWVKPGDADIANGAAPISNEYLEPYGLTLGPVSVTKQPANMSVAEGGNAIFSIDVPGFDANYLNRYYYEQRAAGVWTTGSYPGIDGTPTGTGTPGYTIQWYKGGVAIAGANGPTVFLPNVALSDNGAGVNAVVYNTFSMAASASGTLTVTADTTAPTVHSVAFFTNNISVIYSEPVTSATAAAAANYKLRDKNGSTVGMSRIAMAGDFTVNITAFGLVAGETYSLAVANIKDKSAAGNTMVATTNTLEAFEANLTRINNTQTAAAAGDKITIEAGGADIWGTDDQLAYGNVQMTGNFDVKVRMDNLTRADNWTKAGIMARVTLDQKSRNVFMLGTPATGQNSYVLQWRANTGGDTSSAGSKAVTYPNTWLRLARVGSIFYGFTSADGVTWTSFQTYDTASSSEGAFPATIYVGLAATSHNTASTTKATFTSFGRMPVVPIAITAQPVGTTIVENRPVSFSVTTGAGGPFNYQWQKKGASDAAFVNIAGATSTTYKEPIVRLADGGTTQWRVLVYNSTTSLISDAVKVTVDKDTVAPAVYSAGVFWGGKVLAVRFNEWVDQASAETVANYSLPGYRGSISSVKYYDTNYNLVLLNVNLPLSASATLRIAGVKDLAGNVTTSTNEVEMAYLSPKDVGQTDLYTDTFTDPITNGLSYAYSARDFEANAGGSDIGNTNDGLHFVYTSVTNDFDVRVRVESITQTAAGAKAGLMARYSTNAGSPNVSLVVSPAGGNNRFEQNVRATENGATAAWPGTATRSPSTFPNSWVRLVRQDGVFTALVSADGINWIEQGTLAAAGLPDTLLVGMATSAGVNSGVRTRAMYRDLVMGTPAAGPTPLSAIADPTLTKVTVSFSKALFPQSVTQLADYRVDNGLTITAASLDSTGSNVVLTTSQQVPGALYTINFIGLMGTDGSLIRPYSRIGVAAWTQAAGFLYREVWNGIAAPLSNLKASAKYPLQPDSVGFLTRFEAPSNAADNYSQKVSGFIVPPVSGDYTFFISAASQAELYLSADQTSAGKALIARVASGTGIREWNKEAGQKSVVKTLVAGSRYYVEALAAAGTGDDNLSVTWTTDGSTPPNGSAYLPIGRDAIATYGNPDATMLFITTQPASYTTIKTQPASFAVDAFGLTLVNYQWQKQAAGSSIWFDIDGAMDKTYRIARAPLSDNGAKYRAVVSVPGVILFSDAATLTVTDDTTAPILLAATGTLNGKNITLVFNEKLDPIVGNDRLSYIMFGGYSVSSATVQADGKTVVLVLDRALTESQNVWAWKVVDLAGNLGEQVITPIQLVGGAPVGMVESRSVIQIQRSGDSVVVTWPAAFGSELKLQSSSFNGTWMDVNADVTVVDENNTVVLPIDSANKVYRLNK